MSVKYGSNRFFPRGDSGGGVIPPGAGLWTLYGGTVVGLTDLTETVAIGASTMLADEKLRVAGGIASTPTVAGNDAFVQVGSGDNAVLSGANSFRLIYNVGTAQAEISTNGGAYVPLSSGGASPWTVAAGVITEVVPANLVVVGSAAALNADQFQVLGDSTLRPTVDSTATFEVQDSATATRFQIDTVNNAAVVTGSFQMIGASAEAYLESQPSTAPVSGAGAGRIRYNNVGTPSWQGSVNGGAWFDFVTSGTISGTAFVQNGNAFGVDAVLGTNDAFALQFETNGSTKARILSTGEFLVGSSATTYSEKLGVLSSYSGSASYKVTEYVKNTTTSNDAGGTTGLAVETAQTAGTSGYHEGLNIVARSESTGAITDLIGATINVTTQVAGAAGAITRANGLFVAIGHFGAGTASIVNANCIYVSPPTTAAGRTITNNLGINVQNQGATGVTTAIGIDVAAQSGAATTNLGIRSQSAVVVGTSTVAGTESLRVASGGAYIDGTQFTATVSGACSINSSGAPINIGNDAVAQAINVGTGAAARSINIGNTTGATSIANSFGTNGFGLIQSAASSGTPVGVLMTAGAHSGIANAEATDVNFNLSRTVTFSGGGAAIATQRAFRLQAPTYAAAAAQTINRAATLEITGAPVQGANVTFSAVSAAGNGAYALNVAGGPTRFSGDVYLRDTATAPGVNGLYSTDSANNGFRVYQLSAANTFWTNVGSTTAIIFQPNIFTQGTTISSFGDGTTTLGGASNRFSDAYMRRTFLKDHAAFTDSWSITSTGAVQTTDATVTSVFTSPSLLDNSSYWVEVWVTARDTGSANRAMYQRQVCVYRQGGGGATILTGVLAPVTVESVAAWNADIDVTGNTFRVRVTGAALTTINWTCTVRYQGVSGNA